MYLLCVKKIQNIKIFCEKYHVFKLNLNYFAISLNFAVFHEQKTIKCLKKLPGYIIYKKLICLEP